MRKHFRDLAAAEAAAEATKSAKAARQKARSQAGSCAALRLRRLRLAAPRPTAALRLQRSHPHRAAAGSDGASRELYVPRCTARARRSPARQATRDAPPQRLRPGISPAAPLLREPAAPPAAPGPRQGAPLRRTMPARCHRCASLQLAPAARPASSPASGAANSAKISDASRRTAEAPGQSRPGAPQRHRPVALRQRPSRRRARARPGGPPRRFPQRPGGGPGGRAGQSSDRQPAPGARGVPKAEPGKPLYARKPACTRGRPLIEKRFAEGERKLHPVRTRAGVGPGGARPRSNLSRRCSASRALLP